MNPRIAFVTTCKGRTQHLELTLPQNLEDNWAYEDLKFIVLDYGSQDHLEEYTRATFPWELENGRLVVYSFKDCCPFRMAHAKNMAHRLGILEGAQILVNVDADNYTGEGFASYVAERMAECSEECFLWSKWNQSETLEGEKIHKGCGGRIAVKPSTFLKIGGYDERFNTWSPDDKDFHHRLKRLGIQPRQIHRDYLRAVLHNDKMRFKEYGHAKEAQQKPQFEAVVTNDNTVVNFGRIGTGVVYKNFGSDPIAIEPVPTRIFGIGIHKTATTSLNAALKILGYESNHWKDAHWAKAIWEEMTMYGRSRTLEGSYALSDLPIPLLYQQLDSSYPGSKFILTTRNEEYWLRSVEEHFSERNPFQYQWDEDPFTHKVHTLVYGRRKFDRDVFLERYRRHNAEVMAYFKNRPGDLVIMDMDAGAGWKELCGFLQRPIPTVNYPRAFQTRKP